LSEIFIQIGNFLRELCKKTKVMFFEYSVLQFISFTEQITSEFRLEDNRALSPADVEGQTVP